VRETLETLAGDPYILVDISKDLKMRYLLLLFIIMPILEIGVLIRVGGWLGL